MVILGHCITARASVLDTVLRTPIDIVVQESQKAKSLTQGCGGSCKLKTQFSSGRVVYGPLVYLTMFEDTVKFGVRGS